MPDAITANRLTDGVVVFQTSDNGWAEDFNRAAVLRDAPATAEALKRAKQDEANNIVVDPYAIEVESGTAISRPRLCARRSAPPGPRSGAIWASRRRARRRARVQAPRRPTMYRYDEFDAAFVAERVAQFRDQVARRLSGELTEDQFRPLRLMNGVYLQLHAYMLRVAIPYGTLNSRQLRKLADIARKYDRGYGHFTTRQNIQFNWPALKDTPDILAELASVEMHAIQTSGNCIRNVTADHFAGVARRRNRGPAPLRRNPAAMVVAASRILVPAAQVQDRRQRRAARPRRDPGA